MKLYVIKKDTIFDYLRGVEAPAEVAAVIDSICVCDDKMPGRIYYCEKERWYSCVPGEVFKGIRHFIDSLGTDYCLVPDEDLAEVLREYELDRIINTDDTPYEITDTCDDYWEVDEVTSDEEVDNTDEEQEEFIIARTRNGETVYEKSSGDIMSHLTDLVDYLDKYHPEFFQTYADCCTGIYRLVTALFGK